MDWEGGRLGEFSCYGLEGHFAEDFVAATCRFWRPDDYVDGFD